MRLARRSGRLGASRALSPLPSRFWPLDGGGSKALFTAHVLARLEQDLGAKIKDSFDLIAGTSAGGIVALALGAGLTPSEIVGHYEELVEAVFPAARRRLWRRPGQRTAPIDDGDALRTALMENMLVGNATIASTVSFGSSKCHASGGRH